MPDRRPAQTLDLCVLFDNILLMHFFPFWSVLWTCALLNIFNFHYLSSFFHIWRGAWTRALFNIFAFQLLCRTFFRPMKNTKLTYALMHLSHSDVKSHGQFRWKNKFYDARLAHITMPDMCKPVKLTERKCFRSNWNIIRVGSAPPPLLQSKYNFMCEKSNGNYSMARTVSLLPADRTISATMQMITS